ncbi:MAG: hypothetical protein R2825_24375 [Saprospiraceae bacterium]
MKNIIAQAFVSFYIFLPYPFPFAQNELITGLEKNSLIWRAYLIVRQPFYYPIYIL